MSDTEQQRRRFLERGRELYLAGRLTDALVEVERALSLAPDDDGTLLLMAAIYMELSDLDRAREYAQRAIEANPQNADALGILATRHLLLGNGQEAYKVATSAVEIAPDDVSCLHLLALSALALSREEEAQVLGEMLMEMSPETIEGFQVLAMVARERNDLPTSVKWYQRVLALSPNDPGTLANLAEVQQLLRRDHASAEYLQASLGEDPHDTKRQLNLRDTLHRLAIFGTPGQRLQSVGAKVSGIVAVCLLLWIGLTAMIPDAAVRGTINRTLFFGLPIVAVAVAFLLRERYLSKNFPQFAYAFRFIRRGARRRTVIGVVVILACVGGMVTILADENVDPLWRYSPAWLPFAGLWIAIALLPCSLVRVLLMDVFVRGSESSTDVAAAASTFNLWFISVSCLLFLALSAASLSAWLFLPALLLFIAASATWFRRNRYWGALGTFLATLVLHPYYYLFPNILDLTPEEAFALLRFFSFVLLYLAVRGSLQNYRQRRRLRKLLGESAVRSLRR